MISVTEALSGLFDLVAPLQTETVALADAGGRVLAGPVAARRDQPPFPAAAMDGYAVTEADAVAGRCLSVVGEAAAGRRHAGRIEAGQAVRIFTGAPVPDGAKRVVIQEDVTRDGDTIRLGDRLDAALHIRPAACDFAAGLTLGPGRRLRPADIALLAAMNVARVPVTRRPDVAILSTGDELVMPGETPGPDQIIASNGLGLAAMAREAGASPRLLPIARDRLPHMRAALDLALDADLIVTTGGASVGDHDLMAQLGGDAGFERRFHKVAMRPGKPLLAGRLGRAPLLGLPGNPVSAMICGRVFMVPMIEVLTGLPARPAQRDTAPLAADLPANGPREHYMRATLGPQGVAAASSQDSGLLSVLAHADALIVRPPGAAALQTGASVEILHL